MKVILEGSCTSPLGFQAAALAAGIKKAGEDMALIYSEKKAVSAGVFTTNKVAAAPVHLDKKHLADSAAQAVIVNSGNANACNGQRGMEDASLMARLTAEGLNISEDDVLVCSTGVIGLELPMDKVTAGIKQITGELSSDKGLAAAKAIMTTDTFAKHLAVEFELGGKKATIGGIAKGSGMIQPNMATMLAFLTTDAAVDSAVLHSCLVKAVNKSFNLVTVDGDTSTNDTLLIMANGMAGNAAVAFGSPEEKIFQEALDTICIALAKMMAKDGEGATKLVEVQVKGALTEADAKKTAMAIANSNLVKTAIFGEDANWGRVIAAVGYSGAEVDPEKIEIVFASEAGRETMALNGQNIAFSEENASRILAEKELIIMVDLHLGQAEVTAWTCDFSYDYVKINGSYRS